MIKTGKCEKVQGNLATMSPGINNQPRSTGTLPKSNRNRGQSRILKSQGANPPGLSGNRCPTAERANNLFSLGWSQITEPEAGRVAKNSNKTSTDLLYAYNQGKLGSFNISERRISNVYIPSESACWWKMTPPVESSGQAPLNPQSKPTNTDKMPDRGQVETRLNQIRDYIKVTSSMMESLSQSNDPNGEPEILVDVAREQQIRKRVEDSQRKLAELQEHQAQLVDMQSRVKERLDAAREAQRALLLEEENEQQAQEEQITQETASSNVTQLEHDAEGLRGKLVQLQSKKDHMDHLVAELQAFEALEQKSENTRNGSRDKKAELEIMKAQLSHLKALMDTAISSRGSIDSADSDAYRRIETNPESDDVIYQTEADTGLNEADFQLQNNRNGQPNVEEIQAVTRELKEQSALLQVARAELQRLKHGQLGHQNPSPSFASTSPPPNLCNLQNGIPEKKQANVNNNNNVFSQIQNFPPQNSRSRSDNLMRKEFFQSSSVNQNPGPEWETRRGSMSQNSQTSTPANMWPPPSMANGQREINMDGTSETMFDMGAPPDGNCWPTPGVQSNNAVGSAEYYRQLLLGSQSQQLQMMCMTIQQCCQLLWAQQREIQTLKTAMSQVQLQLRDPQTLEAEGHSNLSRSVHRTCGDAAEPSTLPPSSSLPNLVTLPNVGSLTRSPPVPPRSEQTQLNNQVPPGNRANNYWDNFRSYSRQNLLSDGNSKTVLEHGAFSGASCGLLLSTASGINITSNVIDKSNRENCSERHSLNLIGETVEAVYPQNLQVQSNLQDRGLNLNVESENPTGNVPSQSDLVNSNEITCAKIAEDISKRDDLRMILMHCLQILTSKKSNSPAPSTVISNSSYTSDDNSEIQASTTNFSSSNNFGNETCASVIGGNESFDTPSTITNNQSFDSPQINDQMHLVQHGLSLTNLMDNPSIIDDNQEIIQSRLDPSNNRVTGLEVLSSNTDVQVNRTNFNHASMCHIHSTGEGTDSNSNYESDCFRNGTHLELMQRPFEIDSQNNLRPSSQNSSPKPIPDPNDVARQNEDF